jgi:hypothetical protein
MSAPENEFPAGAGVTALLGRTDDAAVGITQVQAFSTGFQFTLAVRLCRARPELVHRGLFELISSHVHPGKQIPLENRLLLGLEHADGRRASTVQNMRRLRPGGRPPPGSAPLVLPLAIIAASTTSRPGPRGRMSDDFPRTLSITPC